MKKHFLTSVVVLILILLFFVFCKQGEETFVSEGVIEYEAHPIDQSTFMASLAPREMTVKFKNNKSSLEMSAGMGLFFTSIISDSKTRTLTQIVRLPDNKCSLLQNEAEIKKENDAYPLEITPCKETKIIAGHKCLKAHVVSHLKNEKPTAFDVYYTKEITTKDPNFANPFYKIDGVLMEFQMKKFGMEMKFIAKNVRNEPVEDVVFELPKEYKPVTQKAMNELFENLQ